MRWLAATACLIAALAAAPAATAAPRALAVSFTGAGGTENASMSFVFDSPPACQMRTNLSFQARDIAWEIRFSPAPPPRRRGQVLRLEGDAHVTGTARMHSTEVTEPGCGYSDFSERDCTTAIGGYLPAKLAVRKLRRGYRVTAEVLGSAGSEDEDFAATEEGCTAAIRGPALRASAVLRPAGGRADRAAVSSELNARARRRAARPHYERTESDSDATGSSTSRYVSDVAWSGALSARRVAAGPPRG